MLTIVIPENDYYDPQTNVIKTNPACTATLEHSLISISKWEAKWRQPFLSTFSKESFSMDMYRDYIACMSVTPVAPEIFVGLTPDNMNAIKQYIDNPMTATTFSQRGPQGPVSRGAVTAEVLYYRMFSNQIPIECQKWHLNRLLTLLRVFDIKNSPPQKMSRKDTASRNSQLNAMRRAQMHTRG